MSLVAGEAAAATTAWTGAVDSDWAKAGNWTAGVPAYNTDVVFAGTPPANQPGLSGANRSCNTLDIQTAGWTIGGAGHSLTIAYGDYFRSGGAGTNTLHANLSYGGNSATMHTLTVGSGNTLRCSGTLALPRAVTGNGTLVLTSATPLPVGDWPFGTLTVHVNGPGTVALQGLTFASGGGFGGTASSITLRKYGWIGLADGGIFSPGDCSKPISTLALAAAVNPAGVNMGGPSSKLVIDIGSTPGSNDQIVLGTLSYDFLLNGCELALRGPVPLQDGDYTILTETVAGSDYVGAFGSVTYNGVPATPDHFTVSYRPASILLSVSGMAVEKGTILLVQ